MDIRHELLRPALDGRPVDLPALRAVLETTAARDELASMVLERAGGPARCATAWRPFRRALAVALLVAAAIATGFVGGRLSDTSMSTAFVPPPPASGSIPPRAHRPLVPPRRQALPSTPGATLVSWQR